MLVLQDLYIQHEDLSAQIDFLILTRDKNYIIESKNMYGDVTVTDSGEFYRKFIGRSSKIYSPITQCERHTELIRKIRYNEKANILSKAMFEKYGMSRYRSLVVMANPSGKIHTKYAPKDIKNKIISVDQLVRYIKKEYNAKDEGFEKQMIELGNFFLSKHKNNPQNYMEKYRQLKNLSIVEPVIEIEEVAAAIEEVVVEIEDGGVEIDEVGTVEETMEETLVEEIEKVETIICDRCGSDMVLRVAKRGDNVGEEFYGCSKFPKCRYIIKINKNV